MKEANTSGQFYFSSQEEAQLRDLGIEVIVLFGSRALGLARPGSDFDFGILFNNNGRALRKEHRGDYFTAAYDVLAHKVGDLKGLDLVFLEEAPLELQYHVVKYGVPVYERDQKVFADFKARCILEHADFEPHRKLYTNKLMERISHAAH